MDRHELAAASRKIVEEWGFHTEGELLPRVLLLDAALVSEWADDISHLQGVVTRLATTSELSIGKAALRFTHGAGVQPNASRTPFIGRPDFIFSNGRPKLLELNADSSVGGLVQISALAELYETSGCFSPSFRFRSPLDALVRYLGRIDVAPGQLVVLLSSSTFSPYYRRLEAEMANKVSAALGRSCVVAYPGDVVIGAEYLECDRREVGVVFKLDTMIDDSPFSKLGALLVGSVHTKTKFVSDNAYINVEDKAGIALLRSWIVRHPDLVSSAERAAIERLTVPTWVLATHESPNYADWSTELRQLRQNYVLKRVFSFGGECVVAGASSSIERWEAAIARACNEPELWVAQELVVADRIVCDESCGHLETGVDGAVGEPCVVSPYVFDSEIGGLLCRTTGSPTQGVVGLRSGTAMGLYVVAETKGGRLE